MVQFVAHPNCQQLLASLWYEGLPGFRRRHIVFKVLLTVSVCLLYPILSLLYMVAPKSWIGLFMRRPFIKFICHSASYMTFLCESCFLVSGIIEMFIVKGCFREDACLILYLNTRHFLIFDLQSEFLSCTLI